VISSGSRPRRPSTLSIQNLAQQRQLVDLTSSPWVQAHPCPVQAFRVGREESSMPRCCTSMRTRSITTLTRFKQLGLSVPTTFSASSHALSEDLCRGQDPIRPGRHRRDDQLHPHCSVLPEFRYTAPMRHSDHGAPRGKTTFQSNPGWHAALAEGGRHEDRRVLQPGPSPARVRPRRSVSSRRWPGVDVCRHHELRRRDPCRQPPTATSSVFAMPGDTKAKKPGSRPALARRSG